MTTAEQFARERYNPTPLVAAMSVAHLTPSQLARASGVSRNTICNWLNGQEPGVTKLAKVALALNVNLDATIRRPRKARIWLDTESAHIGYVVRTYVYGDVCSASSHQGLLYRPDQQLDAFVPALSEIADGHLQRPGDIVLVSVGTGQDVRPLAMARSAQKTMAEIFGVEDY